MLEDVGFVDDVADALAALPGVLAVTLGGSRAAGTYSPESDWDLGLYYRGRFDPDDLRALGWPGTVFDIGAWGGGVFNGGAWLNVGGRRVDVHYRDLNRVELEVAKAEVGHFQIEPLAFHIAGVPTYLLVAELAGNRVLRGLLPRPSAYPAALTWAARALWWGRARENLQYAEKAHAAAGRVTPCLALLGVALMQSAHAVAAQRSEWVTNDKTLWDRAGIPGADSVLMEARPDRGYLTHTVRLITSLCEGAIGLVAD